MGMIWETYVWCGVKVYGTAEELEEAKDVLNEVMYGTTEESQEPEDMFTKIREDYRFKICDGYLNFEEIWQWSSGDTDSDDDFDSSLEESSGIIYTLHDKVARSLPHLKSQISTYDYMEDYMLKIQSYTSEVGSNVAKRDLIHYYNRNWRLMVPWQYCDEKEQLDIACPSCNAEQKIPFEKSLWEKRYEDEVKPMEIPVVCQSCKTSFIVKESMHQREAY